ALRGEPLTVYGNGTQTRSFCYVDDLVEGLVRAMLLPGLAGEVVNLGNPDEYSVQELARVIADLCGVPLKVVHLPLPPDDPRRRRPDIARAERILGWTPRTPLVEGLRRTMAHFREAGL
ncbi:MAG: GDP-mannose 4,6-dehydratase, partial [Candidatus Methanomethyliaceae archaeon]